jgi:hypothetical protein
LDSVPSPKKCFEAVQKAGFHKLSAIIPPCRTEAEPVAPWPWRTRKGKFRKSEFGLKPGTDKPSTDRRQANRRAVGALGKKALLELTCHFGKRSPLFASFSAYPIPDLRKPFLLALLIIICFPVERVLPICFFPI